MVFFILLILFLLKTFQQFVKVCLRYFFNVFNSVETCKAAGLFVRSAVVFIQQPGQHTFFFHNMPCGRTFIMPGQEMRKKSVRQKLNAMPVEFAGKNILLVDDSIVRGTQLRDNVKILYDYGAKEVHMRIACPPLIYACPFVGFSASKNALELITRRIIKELEGDENKNLEKYATTGSPEYEKMVSIIAERFGLTSLKFNTLETLIEAIGLPKCKVCTHCFDGSSHF